MKILIRDLLRLVYELDERRALAGQLGPLREAEFVLLGARFAQHEEGQWMLDEMRRATPTLRPEVARVLIVGAPPGAPPRGSWDASRRSGVVDGHQAAHISPAVLWWLASIEPYVDHVAVIAGWPVAPGAKPKIRHEPAGGGPEGLVPVQIHLGADPRMSRGVLTYLDQEARVLIPLDSSGSPFVPPPPVRQSVVHIATDALGELIAACHRAGLQFRAVAGGLSERLIGVGVDAGGDVMLRPVRHWDAYGLEFTVGVERGEHPGDVQLVLEITHPGEDRRGIIGRARWGARGWLIVHAAPNSDADKASGGSRWWPVIRAAAWVAAAISLPVDLPWLMSVLTAVASRPWATLLVAAIGATLGTIIAIVRARRTASGKPGAGDETTGRAEDDKALQALAVPAISDSQ